MEKKEREKFENVTRLLELTVKYRVHTEETKYAHCVHATPFNEDEISKLKKEALNLLNIK